MVAPDIEIVPFEPEHGRHIADHMRQSDAREAYYLAALRPRSAVDVSASTAVEASTVLDGGVPLLMFGISRRTFLSDVGVPWLLGTPDADRYQYRFGRESKRRFTEMTSHFDRLENWALAENGKTLRWLKWLGFDMDEPAPYGVFGMPFVRFGKGLGSCA